MRLYHLSVQNFRGIKSLDWHTNGRAKCLIGPGDSTKTTILDAIELLLLPSWSFFFNDTDFTDGNVSNQIIIEGAVGELSDKMYKDEKFGLYLSGYNETTHTLHDDPREATPVIRIRLVVGESLEPEWMVFKTDGSEPKRMSARDREELGVSRLDSFLDKHLTWGKGSSLAKLTQDKREIANRITDVNREVRKNADLRSLEHINALLELAKVKASDTGGFVLKDFHPGIDAKLLQNNTGIVGLHEGAIPVRTRGLGSKRLIVLAIQLLSIPDGGINLIDEIEAGLEPHRIRRLLLQTLRVIEDPDNRRGQILLTTHSPVVLRELGTKRLAVVRNNSGNVVVHDLNEDCTSTLMSQPESFLAEKVIISEGRTELGILRGIERKRHLSAAGDSFDYRGAVVIEGGGSAAIGRAQVLSDLGYPCCLLLDSDLTGNEQKKTEDKLSILKGKGVKVIQWNDGMCIEERLFSDLPPECLRKIMECIASHKNNNIEKCIAEQMAISFNTFAEFPFNQLDAKRRKKLGTIFRDQEWMKTIPIGEEIGEIIFDYLNKDKSDLNEKLRQLFDWVSG